jgi:ferredoxin-type protein NapF
MAASPGRRRLLFGRPAAARAAGVGEGCLERAGITCRACGDACDRAAIGFLPLAGGHATPVIDPARCDACGQCLPVCPAAAITLEPVHG